MIAMLAPLNRSELKNDPDAEQRQIEEDGYISFSYL